MKRFHIVGLTLLCLSIIFTTKMWDFHNSDVGFLQLGFPFFHKSDVGYLQLGWHLQALKASVGSALSSAVLSLNHFTLLLFLSVYLHNNKLGLKKTSNCDASCK